MTNWNRDRRTYIKAPHCKLYHLNHFVLVLGIVKVLPSADDFHDHNAKAIDINLLGDLQCQPFRCHIPWCSSHSGHHTTLILLMKIREAPGDVGDDPVSCAPIKRIFVIFAIDPLF